MSTAILESCTYEITVSKLVSHFPFQGLNYIHGSELKVHGNLTSANCLLDNRWTCKLSGFGVRTLLRGEKQPEGLSEQARYESQYPGVRRVHHQRESERYSCL